MVQLLNIVGPRLFRQMQTLEFLLLVFQLGNHAFKSCQQEIGIVALFGNNGGGRRRTRCLHQLPKRTQKRFDEIKGKDRRKDDQQQVGVIDEARGTFDFGDFPERKQKQHPMCAQARRPNTTGND